MIKRKQEQIMGTSQNPWKSTFRLRTAELLHLRAEVLCSSAELPRSSAEVPRSLLSAA